MGDKVVSYQPGRAFPAVSMTGSRCELQCDHCRGHYLRGMTDASRPGSLPEVATALKGAGAVGILLSGGCDRQGKLPVLDRVDEVMSVRRLGLRVNIHTGLLGGDDAQRLVGAGADCYSVDIVQDRTVIRDVLHLKVGPEAYSETLNALFSARAGRVVPHICVGLKGDDHEGEMASVDLVGEFPIAALVLLWRLPTPGTPMRTMRNVTPDGFLRVVRHALQTLDRPVLLGCMRPRGMIDLEVEAVRLGVAGVASPAAETLRRLELEGYEVVRSGLCCALHE
jgi:uncharacterized radical SAM superfamily protein